MTSPTAGNQRPWHFYVVKNKEILVELSKTSLYAGPMANAPLGFVICYDKSNMIFPPYADIDCAINGKTIGIIGAGNIGKKVIKIAQAMGMKV